jgi:hypothetical protein
MKHRKQTINELVNTTLKYLEKQRYSKNTIKQYYFSPYKHLLCFAEKESVKHFSLDFGFNFGFFIFALSPFVFLCENHDLSFRL